MYKSRTMGIEPKDENNWMKKNEKETMCIIHHTWQLLCHLPLGHGIPLVIHGAGCHPVIETEAEASLGVLSLRF